MKIVFLCFMFFLNLFSFSQNELIDLYEINFKKEELLKVQERDNYYFILSSSISFTKTKVESKKLNLISKALLFQYIKKQDKKIKNLEFKEFQNAFFWQNGDREYLFSFIKKENVKPIYKLEMKNQKKYTLDHEIKFLEEIIDKNEMIHQQLKSLYFQNGDFENYSRKSDDIINLKFEGF